VKRIKRAWRIAGRKPIPRRSHPASAVKLETEPTFSITPNHCNLETQIKFQNFETTVVSVSIYNSMQQFIKSLVNKSLPEGSHTFIWDGKNAAADIFTSGLYFCCLRTIKNAVSQKLLLRR
jgi:hypothetical protein